MAVHHDVEDANLAVAVERRDQQLSPGTHARDLRAGQRRSIEVATLGGLGGARAPGGKSVDGPDVVDLAAGVAAPGPGEVEGARMIDRERGRRRNPVRDAPFDGVEAVAGDIDLHGEAGRQENFRIRSRSEPGKRQHERCNRKESSSHLNVMLR